jgi:hypothetical protein
VCVLKREIEKERNREQVCVCKRERHRDRQRDRDRESKTDRQKKAINKQRFLPQIISKISERETERVIWRE